ncbi:acyltransferase family protein [Microbacterium sp. NPDC055903]
MTSSPVSPRIVEIEGLRGIALTLVVLFHLFGDGRVSGGVDVFLVISAFLLSGSMIRKTTRPEGPRLVEHFSTVAARLVPPAAIVLLFVFAVTLTLVPSTSVRQNLQEILASALYYENWELIGSQLAYGAAGPDTSPLQHFWSLAVQGQFFLVWPFLAVAVVWVARRSAIPPRVLFVVVSAVLTVLSAVYAFWLVDIDQPVAYFSTFARFWELGIGVLLGLLLPVMRIAPWLKTVFAWSGLTLIVACGFVLDGGALFPGPWTLWPVVGTALVLAGAGAPSPPGPARIIDTPPLRFMARISYALYLWHWPVLIFYIQLRDQEGVSWKGAILILGVSILLAWGTQALTGTSLTRLRASVRPSMLIATSFIVALVVVASTTTAIRGVDDHRAQLIASAELSPGHVGALELAYGIAADASLPDQPALDIAFDDAPAVYADGCVESSNSAPGDQLEVCDSAPENASRTIILAGDSHASHLYPAIAPIAKEEGWRLIVMSRNACRITAVDTDGVTQACATWLSRFFAEVAEISPDAVITMGTRTSLRDDESEEMSPAEIAAWRELDGVGVPVIAVRDNPRFPELVPECLVMHPADPASCGRDREDALAEVSPFTIAEGIPANTVEIDLSDALCDDDRCEAVIGNIVAYRDQHHLTATFAQTLAPVLREQLEQKAPWLF